MTAAQVLLDDSSFWLLVALMCLASATAIVASLAAWRAAKSARVALSQLEAARREAVVPEREWRERSPVPRLASDIPAGGGGDAADRSPARETSAIPAPAPPIPAPPSGTAEAIQAAAAEAVRTPGAAGRAGPAPSGSPTTPTTAARRSDMLEDPDRSGGIQPGDLPPRRVTTTPPPDELRTEPLSRPRQPWASEEREVQPGVFVTTPGRTPFIPGPPAPPAPPGAADALSTGASGSEPGPPPAELPAPGAPSVASPAGFGSRPPVGPQAEGAATTTADPRLQKLDDPDPFVRIEAMEQLRGHPGLFDALIRRLRDDFPVARRQAVRALKEAGTPEATKALLEVASQDPSAEVREEAVLALAALLGGGRSRPGAAPGSGDERPKNGTDET